MVTFMRNKHSLLAAALLLAFPGLAAAQAPVIVPPPAPNGIVAPPQPGGLTQANPSAVNRSQAAPVPPAALVPPPTPQEGVLPPDTLNGVKPADQASAGLINVDLPAMPERPPVSDLKPKAPGTKTKPAKKPARAAEPEKSEAVAVKLVEDPFAGIASMPVSDSQLNRFVFPEPVEGIYFPEGTPLPECPKDAGAQDPCKPVFLNGKRMVLIQFRAGAQGPAQMLVHLHSGRMLTLNLMPARGPGAVIRMDGAEDGPSDTRRAEAKTALGKGAGGLAASEMDVALLARFARGDIPDGFEPVDLGKAQRYDLFDVIPMATWSNGGSLRIHLMQVKAFGDAPVAVNSGLFRGPHIKAVALDRETITEHKPALLYLLEQQPAEIR